MADGVRERCVLTVAEYKISGTPIRMILSASKLHWRSIKINRSQANTERKEEKIYEDMNMKT